MITLLTAIGWFILIWLAVWGVVAIAGFLYLITRPAPKAPETEQERDRRIIKNLIRNQ